MCSDQASFIKLLNSIPEPFFQDLGYLIYADKITFDKLPYRLIYEFEEHKNYRQYFEWYQTARANLKDVNQLKYLPLGKYAEKLIEFYFQFHPHYELLHANVQLIQHKVTLGELDFLVIHKATGKTFHLEFALKYYLKTIVNEQEIFLGPSTKDRLSRKVERLINHQCKHSVINKNLFPEEVQDFTFEPKLILKGCLFYPFEKWRIKKKYNMLNQGWWIGIESIEKLKNSCSHFSMINTKSNWIFPFNNTFKKINYKELIELAEEELSTLNEIMVVRWNHQSQPIDRGFIMRADWPDYVGT